MRAHLVTIVPPVATANKKRNVQNSQKYGTNAVAMPHNNWAITAKTNGPRRPYLCGSKIEICKSIYRINLFVYIRMLHCYTYLSANLPKIIFPTKMPNIKIVCDAFANCSRVHTKFHVIWMVSVNSVRLKSYLTHSAEHLSVIFLSSHVNSTFGAIKMMLIWCQATGNFSKNMAKHTIKCQRPNSPIALWIGSSLWSFSVGLTSLLVVLVVTATVWASTSFAAFDKRINKK